MDKKEPLVNKKVNPKYYTKMTGSLNEEMFLSEQEFKDGKQGYLWKDLKTGKLRFKNDEK